MVFTIDIATIAGNLTFAVETSELWKTSTLVPSLLDDTHATVMAGIWVAKVRRYGRDSKSHDVALYRLESAKLLSREQRNFMTFCKS